jgi:transposase InsO family protein
MDQRVQFIADYLKGYYTKKDLCMYYGISRPTGDKWIERYHNHGLEGLYDRSRRPHRHPDATAPEVAERIVQMKLAHQSFGPKKVMDRLRALEPDNPWPADSTAADILKGNGLVRQRRKRRRVPPDPHALVTCSAPAQSWSADFKGDFRLGGGQRCYPLTLTDNHSRFILQCRALSRMTTDAVKPWFEWVFRAYGLPEARRTDNGAPFASLAAGGLSQLSKWWVRLGIRPERIRPATPSENGRHERMHRSLKEAVINPAASSFAAQQRRFDGFVEEFNWQRSHEALGRLTPGRVHEVSPRPYPAKLPAIEYDRGVTVRQVRHNGELKWRGRLIYLSQVLAQEPIGLVACDNDCWEIRYSFHLLGFLNERTHTITHARQWHQRESTM